MLVRPVFTEGLTVISRDDEQTSIRKSLCEQSGNPSNLCVGYRDLAHIPFAVRAGLESSAVVRCMGLHEMYVQKERRVIVTTKPIQHRVDHLLGQCVLAPHRNHALFGKTPRHTEIASKKVE